MEEGDRSIEFRLRPFRAAHGEADRAQVVAGMLRSLTARFARTGHDQCHYEDFETHVSIQTRLRVSRVLLCWLLNQADSERSLAVQLNHRLAVRTAEVRVLRIGQTLMNALRTRTHELLGHQCKSAW
jgi:hypothetical protein